MQVKVSAATNQQLNFMVAKCEYLDADSLGMVWVPDPEQMHFNKQFKPSTEWAQAGPIIERERITVNIGWTTEQPLASIWTVRNGEGFAAFKQRGNTPLIAAMRSYVTSKIGDVVEIPDELC